MNDLYGKIVSQLGGVYSAGEARAVARVLLDDGFGVTPMDVYADKVREFSPHEAQRLDAMVQRLAQGEPVQYVVGTAQFSGRTYEVTPAVLIPRPETAELTDWAADDLRASCLGGGAHPAILDIGTGSGCIAVTMAKEVAGAAVTAVDISAAALEVARRNAARNGAEVDFREVDILSPAADALGRYDVIMSNPPYVCRSESLAMDDNVLLHEPHGALFVSDDAPLVFYEAIARFASEHLAPGGAVYVEINRRFGRETADVFRRHGLADVELRRDFEDNDRMIKAKKI